MQLVLMTILGLFCPISARGTYLSDSWAMLAGTRAPQPTCVDIPRNFTLCYGIDYQQMRLPNLLDQETMDEVTHQSAAWIPLFRLNCHSDTQLFLCSLFAPVCLDREIRPCRSLCEAVKAGCESRMRTYGFPWPDMLNCANFPLNHDMCIQPRINYLQGESKKKSNSNDNQHCGSCSQVSTYENILDHFCRSDYVAKVKIGRVRSTHVVVKRGRMLKPRGAPSGALKHAPFYYTANNESCPCSLSRNDRKRRFLIMANQNSHGAFVTNLLLPWKKEKHFRRAVKMFKKLNCRTLGTQIRERARRERTMQYRRRRQRVKSAKLYHRV